MFETLVINGTIYDGTGAAPFKGDVGIIDGRIDTIGNLAAAEAKNVINAHGKIVAPGFIDEHTHSDYSLLLDGRAQSQIFQGVTTEVVGNCGFSAAPFADPRTLQRRPLANMLKDVDWYDLENYFNQLEQSGIAVNAASLVGHAALRDRVQGERHAVSDSIYFDDLNCTLDECLLQGAAGLSLGLEYEPGKSATIEELTELASVVAKHDKLLAVHTRNRDVFYDASFAEVLAIARNTGVKLVISHISPKFGAPDDAVERTLEMIDATKNYGIKVTFDIQPDIWSTTTVMAVLPSWAHAGGAREILKRLKDDRCRERIQKRPNRIWRAIIQNRWEMIKISNCNEHPEYEGLNVKEIAQSRGQAPFDAVLDMLIEAGEDMASLHWVAQNFKEQQQLKWMRRSDCGIISDVTTLCPDGPLGTIGPVPLTYTWVARFLGRYIRDQKVLSLREGIRRLTTFAAEVVGITDRGRLAPGYWADVVVFALENIQACGGLENPKVLAQGMEHVMVNGKPCLTNGVFNDEGKSAGAAIRL